MSIDDDYKKKRTRSPAYPAIGLADSIEKARILFSKENRHSVPISVAYEHWGYSPTSSVGSQTVSALKQFGLLLEDADGSNRQVRLSQTALLILLEEENAQERIEAVRDAALTPKIHRELWDKYSGQLGSDASIRSYLTLHREPIKFNTEVVDDFIKQFRATIEFANNIGEQKIGTANAEVAEKSSRLDESANKTAKEDSEKRIVVKVGMKEDIFSLEEGSVILQWPDKLSKTSAQDIKDWLELIGRKIQRAAEGV